MSSAYQIASQRIRRAPYQALAAVSVMTMTLFLACVFFLLAAGSQAVLKYFETRPQVNAFFKADLVPTTEQINTIITSLKTTQLTSSIKYVSKEDALKIYKDLNKSDPLLLEAVTLNMLPASIEVSAKNPSDLKTLAALLKKESGIEDVRFAEDVVASLSKWTNSIRIIGGALVVTHIFMALIVILLIIGIKVAGKREDIHTLRLIGATRGYVAAPFVLEGIIYGLAGGLIAWGTTYLVLLYSMGFLVQFLTGIPILPPPLWFMFSFLGGTLALGIIIGAIGGSLAVNRFFKE